MNFLAGLLLTYLPSEAEAYAALRLLMRQRGLREMYLPDMSLLQIRLWQLSKLLPPRLAAHLEAHAALPVLYASSWLLTCFAADFPLHFAGRVMDVLMTGKHVVSPILKVAVGIVQRCEAALLAMADFEEMIGHLRQEVPRWPKADLQELLTDALRWGGRVKVGWGGHLLRCAGCYKEARLPSAVMGNRWLQFQAAGGSNF